MRKIALIFACLVASQAVAQTTIYRCADRYTNSEAEARARGCKAVGDPAEGKPRPPVAMSPPVDVNELFRAMEEIKEKPRAPPPPKRDLGPIDRWRFEGCLQDAAKNPTTVGVNLAVGLCNERFGQ